MPEIVPTEKGQDLESLPAVGFRPSGEIGPHVLYDAHVRLERDPLGNTVVCADVFDHGIVNNDKAHMVSDCEPWGNIGAARITEFLRSYGFDVRVRFG